MPSFADTFDQLRKTAKKNHRSLLDIIVIDSDAPEWRLAQEDLPSRFGYGEWQIHRWNVGDTVHADRPGAGGRALFLVNGNGQFRSIVFIRTQAFDESVTNKAEAAACANTPLLCHELGHVDDFENGINIVPDKEVDLVQAELYAHHFACRKMMEIGCRPCLWLYLHDGLRQLAQCESECDRRAATNLLQSPEFEDYCRFAGPTFRGN